MLSIIISTIAFFIASFFVNRYLEEMGLPHGMTRKLTVFCAALVVSYGVGALVDWISPDNAAPDLMSVEKIMQQVK